MKQQDGGPDPHLSWPTSFSYNSPGRQMDLGRFTSGINGSFSRSFLQTGSINHQSLVLHLAEEEKKDEEQTL